MDVTFSIPNLDKAEPFDPSWTNAQDLCSLKGSTLQGGVGPFGLLTLASKNLEEYTPVFFRIFKGQDKHVVLLCSDATRFVLPSLFFPSSFFKALNLILIICLHYGSSSLRSTGLYKPSFAGYVNVDLADKKLSLRSLVHIYKSPLITLAFYY